MTNIRLLTAMLALAAGAVAVIVVTGLLTTVLK